MEFKRFESSDYEKLFYFLIALNKDNDEHINWNWARFEWMYEHPMFDKSLLSRIGLWIDNNEVVGCAIYDMYLGEASVLVLPNYHYLYKEILEFAYENIKDNDGLSVAVSDDNELDVNILKECGYQKIDQTETIMTLDLKAPFIFNLDDNNRFYLPESKVAENGIWIKNSDDTDWNLIE